MRKIKRVDYFRKTDSELYKGRSMGACFSLLALIVNGIYQHLVYYIHNGEKYHGFPATYL